jgi:hypothetical protein
MSEQTKPMPYPDWLSLMHKDGWHRHTVTSCEGGEVRITSEWRHGTATNAKGEALTISEEYNDEFRAMWQTPAPF